MRERLLKLIKEADDICSKTKRCDGCIGFGKGAECINYIIADHLLANGVIVPPCKVGDKIYWYNMGGEIVEAEARKIMYAAKHPHGFEYDIGFEKFGKTVFLTREEAEKALKGGEG